jgi:hypothetical protein
MNAFPFRLDLVKKSSARAGELDRKIQMLKDRIKFVIQSNFPVIAATPFLDISDRYYMDRHFGNNPMGQDWRKNVQIQQMLFELSNLEHERKNLEKIIIHAENYPIRRR